jgi:hypothetical protein
MDQEPPMQFEAHQHLQMAQLIRRKAARMGNPPHMLRKANLFLALAKAAAKQAGSRTQAPATANRRISKSPGPKQWPFRPMAMATPLAPPSVNRTAPPGLARSPIRTTLIDPRKLFGPIK